VSSRPPYLAGDLHASAIRFLIDGNEQEAARLLLVCSLKVTESECDCDYFFTSYRHHQSFDIEIRAPRLSYDAIEPQDHPIGQQVRSAVSALIPVASHIGKITVRAELPKADPGWREEMSELLRGANVSNQVAHSPTNVRIWQNLRFRSASEQRVAAALDDTGAMYLPLCMARVNTTVGRANREPDFLVCHHAKWGILEVDGEPFHPPSRKVQGDERDRLFKAHGPRVVEHFDAQVCFEAPHKVVQEFLKLLESS
jgi:hypothetical protein